MFRGFVSSFSLDPYIHREYVCLCTPLSHKIYRPDWLPCLFPICGGWLCDYAIMPTFVGLLFSDKGPGLASIYATLPFFLLPQSKIFLDLCVRYSHCWFKAIKGCPALSLTRLFAVSLHLTSLYPGVLSNSTVRFLAKLLNILYFGLNSRLSKHWVYGLCWSPSLLNWEEWSCISCQRDRCQWPYPRISLNSPLSMPPRFFLFYKSDPVCIH